MDNTYYQFRKKEKIGCAVVGYIGAFFLLYLFYHSLLVSGILAFTGAILFPRWRKKEFKENRQWRLMVQFKDAMDSMVSALAAGYSMENAVSEAYKDLCLLYEQETPMLLELKNLQQKIRLQQPLDKLFLDFGRRSGVEDILTFAQIYATARRSGGNLIKVMRRTANNIGEKMEIQREIQTMAAGKKMEAVCMVVIPLFIILYLLVFSPGFLDPLYQSVGGRFFMTAALIVYIAAAAWSRSIMDIRC